MDPDESKTEAATNNSSNNESPKTPPSNPLKIEWSLFWEGLLGDGDEAKAEDPLKALTREQISTLIKDLSSERKQLHKQIESVNKEIELHTAKLESLKLVGSEPEETVLRLNLLSDKGQELGSALNSLNQKLKLIRSREKEISSKEWA